MKKKKGLFKRYRVFKQFFEYLSIFSRAISRCFSVPSSSPWLARRWWWSWGTARRSGAPSTLWTSSTTSGWLTLPWQSWRSTRTCSTWGRASSVGPWCATFIFPSRRLTRRCFTMPQGMTMRFEQGQGENSLVLPIFSNVRNSSQEFWITLSHAWIPLRSILQTKAMFQIKSFLKVWNVQASSPQSSGCNV